MKLMIRDPSGLSAKERFLAGLGMRRISSKVLRMKQMEQRFAESRGRHGEKLHSWRSELPWLQVVGQSAKRRAPRRRTPHLPSATRRRQRQREARPRTQRLLRLRRFPPHDRRRRLEFAAKAVSARRRPPDGCIAQERSSP